MEQVKDTDYNYKYIRYTYKHDNSPDFQTYYVILRRKFFYRSSGFNIIRGSKDARRFEGSDSNAELLASYTQIYDISRKMKSKERNDMKYQNIK